MQPPTPRTRQLQVAGAALLSVVALALVAALLLRPGPAVEGAGAVATPGSGASSTAPVTAGSSSTPGASSSAAGTASSSAGESAELPALTAAPPSSAVAGEGASVASGTPVVFVGDGLDPTGAANDWSAQAASALAGAGTPLARTVAAADGAGWGARSSDGRTFADLVDGAVGPQTRLVVVLGSRNDAGDPSAVAAGVQSVVRVVRDAAPQAQVLLVAPQALGGDSAPAQAAVARALAGAAATAGVPLLDPAVAGSPLTGGATSTADGTVRLTLEGQRQTADVVLPALQRLLGVGAGTPSG